MDQNVIDLVKEKGLLLEKGVFEIVEAIGDGSKARSFLETLQEVTDDKMITTTTLGRNIEVIRNVVDDLSGENKDSVEKIIVKLGLSIQVEKSKQVENNNEEKIKNREDFQIFYTDTGRGEKIEVKDFVAHFRARYTQLQRIIMQRPGLENLTSINKLSKNRQQLTIIGMVVEKRISKNKNLLITLEDMTGRITALVKEDSEIFQDAKDLQLDDVIAFKGSGNNEILFGYEIIYPDSMIFEKKRFDNETCVAFISDIHVGSNKHMGLEFQRFLNWLKTDHELAKKLKYIFIVGDNVDGVSVFPGQEKVLTMTSFKEQYNALAGYLSQVPKHITMFMCPGQHDSVRVPEPQPIIDNYYGKPLYDIENLVLVSNPTTVKLIEGEKEFKILMYHGASIHRFINEIEKLRLMKAHKTPAKAVREMLRRRHLAPTHSAVTYIPNGETDPLVIGQVPDVLCTGEVHRLDIENYNGVIIITGSCWQSQTEFEEKVGNIPDPCKVPIMNLKTREVNIMDFSSEESGERVGDGD